MEDNTISRKDVKVRPNYHDPPPVTVPRSQYATTDRSHTHGPQVTRPAPRYFSSPFRAPLNQQDRHDSYAAHQRTISNAQDSSSIRNRPKSPPHVESTSYTFFHSGTTITSDVAARLARPDSSVNGSADDVSQSSRDQPNMVRKASIGHRVKPALTEVRRSDSTQTSKTYTEPKTPPPRADTIDALNAAITAAIKSNNQTTTSPRLLQNEVHTFKRPDSPTSTYSQDFHPSRKSQPRASSVAIDTNRISPLQEEFHTPLPKGVDRSSPLPGPTPHSEKSTSSTKPLLGLGIEHKAMDSRIPPRLDMKAVHDMESRGSITSLPDLIRRATKLASNLDRGKTASRLGLWDMFSNTDHVNTKKRESTYSDVLNAFPDPASGTSPRPKTMWPSEPKEEVVVVTEEQEIAPTKSARKCCGLSVTTFIVVALIVILLIAAAVLIPIFLVLIPRQNALSKPNIGNCAASRPCQNNGISVVDNNSCSCICVNGFTGSDCSNTADPNCITVTLTDGSRRYQNATLGSSINSLLIDAQGRMNIPLNTSTLLSLFASNNLTCAGENSLVQFDTERKRRSRRFLIIPGLEPTEQQIVPIATPSAAKLIARQNSIQTGIQTVNSIVYQASVSQASVLAATTSASIAATSTNTSPTSTAASNPSSTNKANITSNQLEFAQLVVLYVLVGSRVPSTAVVTKNNLQDFLQAGALSTGNKTVHVAKMGNTEVTANFEELSIVLSDGKVIGGNRTSI